MFDFLAKLKRVFHINSLVIIISVLLKWNEF